ncbi:unnamed protein product [Mytilus edulis]|uniref:Uncharacterized protein n=1 Tax=Mytilus edulis TaxID=6550 RepID=A0A8S3UKT5_MYTED|nr:unnamed protein product [Mytilus edulis]
MPQVPKTHQQFLDAASIAEKTVQMTTAKPIENLTLQVANIASIEDRLSTMLTDKLSSSVAEMSAIQAHNNNQSNGPYQRQNYQQRPKTNFQQRNYQRPPSSSCQGCGRYCLNRQSCPAQNSICRFCKVKGHFEQVCRKAKRYNQYPQNQYSQHQNQQNNYTQNQYPQNQLNDNIT